MEYCRAYQLVQNIENIEGSPGWYRVLKAARLVCNIEGPPGWYGILKALTVSMEY